VAETGAGIGTGAGAGLELLATRTFGSCDDMYRIVDFLNKTLKDREIVFGLSKDEDGKMVISIYRT
jgi:hypothetical protein